ALYHDYNQSIFSAALEYLKNYLTFGISGQAPPMMKADVDLSEKNIDHISNDFSGFIKSKQFDRQLQAHWLDKLTSFSFVTRPQLQTALPAKRTERIRATSAHPIL